jgi:hypothetical protein
VNNADFNKLKEAVKKVLSLMIQEHLNQLQVSHRDLHKLADLTNTRSRSLINHVDDVLTLQDIVRGGYGLYLVSDLGVIDGEAQMAFIKQNSGIRHLVLRDDGTLGYKA